MIQIVTAVRGVSIQCLFPNCVIDACILMDFLPGGVRNVGFNEIGCLATTEALKRFNTDGSPIKLGDTKMRARDKGNKTYQTPYGSVQLERYVYQTSKGGRIYCPLEHQARIIRGATPNKPKLLLS
jgi:hypothetical protein